MNYSLRFFWSRAPAILTTELREALFRPASVGTFVPVFQCVGQKRVNVEMRRDNVREPLVTIRTDWDRIAMSF